MQRPPPSAHWLEPPTNCERSPTLSSESAIVVPSNCCKSPQSVVVFPFATSPTDVSPRREGIVPAKYTVAILEDALARIRFDEDGISVSQSLEEEAFQAYQEMLETPLDNLDREQALQEEPSGFVNRRAPKNPLRSPWMGKLRQQPKEPGKKKEKKQDPALQQNPLHGRLIITISSSAVLGFIFLQSLVANKVDTSSFHASKGDNPMLGPAPITLLRLGGLNTNEIRQGNLWRLFWAMWMHSGWIHLGLNIGSQLQFLWMLEPDWGCLRTLLNFFVAGITGNLLSAVCDPCSTTVGSSGALFGLMGGMIPYCVEFWYTIPRPWLILIFSLVVAAFSILTGFSGTTDNWAHMGGLLGGFLAGLATVTALSACNRDMARKALGEEVNSPTDGGGALVFVASDRPVKKRVVKRHALTRFFQKRLGSNCKCASRENLTRLTSLGLLMLIWGVLMRYLLYDYDYAPLGHWTYSGVRQCCCCWFSPAAEDPETWLCNYCNSRVGSTTWGSQCTRRQDIDTQAANLLSFFESPQLETPHRRLQLQSRRTLSELPAPDTTSRPAASNFFGSSSLSEGQPRGYSFDEDKLSTASGLTAVSVSMPEFTVEAVHSSSDIGETVHKTLEINGIVNTIEELKTQKYIHEKLRVRLETVLSSHLERNRSVISDNAKSIESALKKFAEAIHAYEHPPRAQPKVMRKENPENAGVSFASGNLSHAPAFKNWADLYALYSETKYPSTS